jgi:hypothetical protein
MSPEEREFQDFLDKYNIILQENLAPINEKIKKSINEVLYGNLSDEEIEKRKLFIYTQLETLVTIFTIFVSQSIPRAYKFGAQVAQDSFSGLDRRALSILVRDAINDFRTTINSTRSYLTTFFEFSKQGVLTESQLSALVARGILNAGDSRFADQLIKRSLSEKLSEGFLDKIKNDTKKFRSIRYSEIENKNVSEYIKNKLKREFEIKFQDEKYLQIIDKNGKVRNYRIDYYSELVSRTRMADAQIEGVIKESEQNNIFLFRVTSHGTKTPICKKHEGVVYTSDPLNTEYEFLSSENKPTYHPNCQHGLLPYVPRF